MRWTLTLASLVVAAAAQAGDYGGTAAHDQSKVDVPKVDANGDGMVTRDEAQPYPRLTEHFDEVDANKDGQLDAAEVNAYREQMRVEMRAKALERWKAADADGDGSVSRAEAEVSMPRVAERFEKFDANGDGRISRDEMHNFRIRNKASRKDEPASSGYMR
jgi:Ca2+-binding EF-hand superfamily protein